MAELIMLLPNDRMIDFFLRKRKIRFCNDQNNNTLTKALIVKNKQTNKHNKCKMRNKRNKPKSLIGFKSGRLMVIKDETKGKLKVRNLLLECDCGGSIETSYYTFSRRANMLQHCGCRNETSTKRKGHAIYITAYGKTKSIRGWSREFPHIHYEYIRREYHNGHRGEIIFDIIRDKMKFTTIDGVSKPLKKWVTPIYKYWVLRGRWEKGLRGADLFANPKTEYKKDWSYKDQK